ncbi:carbohydrate ABC transporter permease [Nonomuraea roseoviolacea]|uniref:Lactose/L-arabinose transport system permease protein n=1 Tax=Nonomuraea roseoviolacea subsp. carminata TaxID=160689 RepID=A0ABT1K7U4_9ACTN|nr:sugar ABC transporter permease [Nonomuraea roseoviolacea]MCP2350071.1 lactose/L-arabinose transport system permease protein [Nonomuraea roseoviolacea subsp. carminata]
MTALVERAGAPPAHRAPSRRGWTGARLAPYLFVGPALLLFAVFKLYPIAWSFWLSLFKTDGALQTFAGAANYRRLVADPLFWSALGNTVTILLVQVPLMLALAIALAVALNSPLLAVKGFVRLGFFMPMVTGLVAYGLLFAVLLNPQSGLVNWALGLAGVGPVPWLTHGLWAKVAVGLALTWHYTGYNAVIYLARLQALPADHYDAAAVDGAGAWQRFRHVTLPGLRPVMLLTIVMSTIGTLQLFDEPYVMTGGGPDNSTMTLGLYLYANGFKFFDFGYASAIAYALTVIIGILGVVQFKVLGERS